MKRSKSFHNVEQLTGPAVPPQEARIQSIARAKAILDVLTVADRDWTPLRAIAQFGLCGGILILVNFVLVLV
jgi:hypothetical protein